MAMGAYVAITAVLAVVKPPAAPIPIRVEFDAPAGCSSADDFYAGVTARSNRARRASAGEEAVRLGVRVTRTGGVVWGELRILDGKGAAETRRVEGGRCEEVVEVLSLTAALALDPTARFGRLGPPAGATGSVADSGKVSAATPPESDHRLGAAAAASAPSAPVGPPVAVAAAPSSVLAQAPVGADGAAIVRAGPSLPVTPSRGAPVRFGLTVAAAAAAAHVLSPTVDFGGALSLRLVGRRPEHRPASIAITGAYLTNDPWPSARSIVVRWIGLTLTVCPGLGVARAWFEVDFCAQAVGGRLSISDHQVTNPAPASRLWGSLGGMARFAVPVGSGFSLEAEAGVGIPVVERRFITTTPEVAVGQTPPLAVTGSLGVAHEF